MDLFELHQPYEVLICRKCQYCVRASVSALTTHLRAQHTLHPDVRAMGQEEQLGCFGKHSQVLRTQHRA
jgi:hypothetical protein